MEVEVDHVDAHVPKSHAAGEHHNNGQVHQAAKIKLSQLDVDWQHKRELFLAWWAHDASDHQGRDATYRWACDCGVDLTMDITCQVVYYCETGATIQQAKRVNPCVWGTMKYKYAETWQIDYIPFTQTCQGKCYVLMMVETATEWLERYPVPHATT